MWVKIPNGAKWVSDEIPKPTPLGTIKAIPEQKEEVPEIVQSLKEPEKVKKVVKKINKKR